MKKYFLDERYRKFTRRVCTVLSILVGIIVLVIVSVDYKSKSSSLHDSDYAVIGFLSVLSAIGVWLLYWVIRWILKTLPDE